MTSWRAGAICLAVGAMSFAASPAPKPNILFIAVDDLNVDLGTFGHGVVRTPNLDRLAARGVTFERAYCQFPLCSPSRESFLSGLRPETSGAVAQGLLARNLKPDAVYLPAHFRAHGYFTAGFGKIFHKNDPSSWEHYETGDPVSPQETKALKGRAETRDRGENGPEWHPIDDADETMGDGIVARSAAATLRRAAKDTRPFFVAAGFRKPHLPWTAPRRFFEQYPQTSIPPRRDPAMRDIPPIALQTDLFGTPKPEPEWQAIAAYYACVSFIDEQIGLLLATMDELKLWDRTIVVFMADHGFHLGDHDGLWAKLTTFERSARVPLIIAPPRSAHAGRRTTAIAEVIDLYPTLAELCALPRPAHLEGRSLVAQLTSPGARAEERAAYTTTIHQGVMGRSVRTARWRYTEWGEGVAAELYDHDADPGEYRNLVGEPARAAEVTALKALLARNPRLAGPVPADAQTERKGKKK